jgi:hypothetical protein
MAVRKESGKSSGASSYEAEVRRDGTAEGEVVSFEAVLRSEGGISVFSEDVIVTPGNVNPFAPKSPEP